MSQKNKVLRGNESLTSYGVNVHLDVKKAGYLRKLKKMKKRYFVLRKQSDTGPARLEYHSSEKKWKAGNDPRRTIVLKSCFNISRKLHSKNKFIIALYTQDDCFSVVTENEEELEQWLSIMQELQREDVEMDEDLNSKPVFDHVWQVIVDDKELDYSQEINGPYRLGLTSKTLSLVKMNSASEKLDIIEFPLMSIRRCGHSGRHFFIEVGRSAVTGAGGIWMETEATIIAQNMHETILGAMKSSRNREELGPLSRPRSASTSENSKPIATRRPLGLNLPQSLSTINASISNSRERCDSLPSRPRNSSENSSEPSYSPMSAQLTPSGKLYHKENSRPHSMYAWPALNSPTCNNLSFSPGSLSASFCSTGSNLSSDESENFQHIYLSRYSYVSSGDGILSTEGPITEVPDEYLMMSPTSEDKSIVSLKSDYLIMDPSVKNTNADVMQPIEKINSSPTLPIKSAGNSGTVDYMDMASPTSSNQESYIPMSVIGSLNLGLNLVNSSSEEVLSSQQSVTKSNGYVVMAPGGAANDMPVTLQEGYLDMMPLSSSLPSDFHDGFHIFDNEDCSDNNIRNFQDIMDNSSSLESKDTFILDKVTSFVKQTDASSPDYITPARTYSVGCRSQVGESRTRAYSFGSQATENKWQRSIHSYNGDLRNIDCSAKSSSAPVLPNNFSKSSMSSKDCCESDLMEIDYDKLINNVTLSTSCKNEELICDRNLHSTRHRSNSRSSCGTAPMMLLNEVNENFSEQSKNSLSENSESSHHNLEILCMINKIPGENIDPRQRKIVEKDNCNAQIAMKQVNDLNAASQDSFNMSMCNEDLIIDSQNKETYVPNILDETVDLIHQCSEVMCDNLNESYFPSHEISFHISSIDQNINSNTFQDSKAKQNSYVCCSSALKDRDLQPLSKPCDKNKVLNVVKEHVHSQSETSLKDCEGQLKDNKFLVSSNDAKFCASKFKSVHVTSATEKNDLTVSSSLIYETSDSVVHKKLNDSRCLTPDVDGNHGDYVSLDLGKVSKYNSPTVKCTSVTYPKANQVEPVDSDFLSGSSENHEYVNVWLGKPKGVSSDSISCSSDSLSSPLFDAENKTTSHVSNLVNTSETVDILEGSMKTMASISSESSGSPCSSFSKNCLIPSKPSRCHHSLPAFRKQMSAPAAPPSLRPELPSPGRKSSCPVTASASMVRSSVMSPAASIKLTSPPPFGGISGLLKVNSKSPDHSSVSSISSISDEISSNHSSPKIFNITSVNTDRKTITETQYENVSILPRSASNSRPSSVSSEKELNYASLDLAPSSNDEAPRSPRMIKVLQPEICSDGPPLSYAEIDFTKSEGLRYTSGTLRESRL